MSMIVHKDSQPAGVRIKLLDENGDQIGLAHWVDLETCEYERAQLETFEGDTPPEEWKTFWHENVVGWTNPLQRNPDGSLKMLKGVCAKIEITPKAVQG